MNFVGIIAEYDPFHSGHALQLRMLRQRGASTIAVCMSTGVVQRGGVPILPEAVRVRAALAAGADLVVALPAPYANASAEQFAAAGVHLLAALGCDTLAFGAETPEPAPLQAAAAALCSAAFPAALRSQLESGLPFAAARAAAREAETVNDLYDRLKTKRYPTARLRRLVLDAVLDVPAAGLPALPPYLLVLGAKRSALPLLKHAKIPAGTSLAGLAGQDQKLQIAADMHSKAVDFSLLCRYKIQPMGLAYTAHVVLL